MSRRHRPEAGEGLAREERQAHAKRERQRINAALRGMTTDGEVDDPTASWRQERHHDARSAEPGAPGSRRVRHWKRPFWKRRTNARKARAVAERQVAEEL